MTSKKTRNSERTQKLKAKKLVHVTLLLSAFVFLWAGAMSCANDLAPSIGEIKAYPNPFAPGGSNKLTVEPTSGTFANDSRVILKVLDYNLTQVFEKEFSPKTAGTAPDVIWSGYIGGKRLAPGMYTIRLDITLTNYESRSAETRLIVE